MQIIDKIKILSNFSQKEIAFNKVIVSFLEMVTSQDDFYVNEKKRVNRNKNISKVLGEISEYKEEDNYLDTFNLTGTEITNEITHKVFSKNCKAIAYNNIEEVYDHLIKFIDNNTRKAKISPTISSFDLNVSKLKSKPGYENMIDYELMDSKKRMILTKIIMGCNVISMESRLGYPKSLIVGKDNWDIFNCIMEDGKFNNLSVILDSNIESDKVVICSSHSGDYSGIFTILDEKNKLFILDKTNLWEKNYLWFTLTS